MWSLCERTTLFGFFAFDLAGEGASETSSSDPKRKSDREINNTGYSQKDVH